MFLFLSKLLPLLLYPLGLTCVLVLGAIVLLQIFPVKVASAKSYSHSSGHSPSHQGDQHPPQPGDADRSLAEQTPPNPSHSHASRHRKRHRHKHHRSQWSWLHSPVFWVKGLLGAAIVLLWFSSTQLCSTWILGNLERQYTDFTALEKLPSADAIVVLGGATIGVNPPRRYPELNDAGDRLVQAVRLYRAGKAPKIILSGGRIEWAPLAQPTPSEAEDMQVLLHLFGIPDRDLLLDKMSLNTYQNAVNTEALLKKHNLKTIILVTSAFHMPRALAIFRKLGIETTPAPTDFRSLADPQAPSLQGFFLKTLPSADYLYQTSIGLKEYLGILIYRLRGWAT